MMRAAAFALVSLVALLLVACGGGDDAASPTPTATPAGADRGGPPLSDEQYLEVICSGLADYTATLLTASNVDEIRGVVQEYIESLEAISPPEDVAGFHAQFIAYLTEALEDPTALVATPRPLPPDDIRERLAGLESSVPACDDATYFATREEDGAR